MKNINLILTPDSSYILKYRLRAYYFFGEILLNPNVQSAFSSPREHSTEQLRETSSQATAINILHPQCLGWRLYVVRPMEEEEEGIGETIISVARVENPSHTSFPSCSGLTTGFGSQSARWDT